MTSRQALRLAGGVPFDWSDIVDVEIVVDHGLLEWRVPKLWLSSGKSVWLHEVGQLRDGPGRVAELVAEIERHMAAVGQEASAGEARDENAQDLPGREGVHE